MTTTHTDSFGPAITIAAVINFMAERTMLKPHDFTGERRARKYAFPRQIAMWLCVETLPASLPMIGRGFNRDHTTIMQARDKINALRARDVEVRYLTDHLLRELGATYPHNLENHPTVNSFPPRFAQGAARDSVFTAERPALRVVA